MLEQLALVPPGTHALDNAPTIKIAHQVLGNQVGEAGEDYHQFLGDVQHLIRAVALDVNTTSTWVGTLVHASTGNEHTISRLERTLRLTAQEPVYRPYQERINAAITDLMAFSEHTQAPTDRDE